MDGSTTNRLLGRRGSNQTPKSDRTARGALSFLLQRPGPTATANRCKICLGVPLTADSLQPVESAPASSLLDSAHLRPKGQGTRATHARTPLPGGRPVTDLPALLSPSHPVCRARKPARGARFFPARAVPGRMRRGGTYSKRGHPHLGNNGENRTAASRPNCRRGPCAASLSARWA